jgi:hypothetical protein
VWSILVISKEFFKFKKFLLVSAVNSGFIFLIRNLPIDLGVHTIIGMIVIICVMRISGIEIVKDIYSTLLTFLLFTVSELLNVIILNFFNISTNINSENIDPIYKSIIGIPSLIFFSVFIMIIFRLRKKKEGIKSVCK